MKFTDLVTQISGIDGATRLSADRALQQILSLRNWLIGAHLVEFEQAGEDRAAYGENLIVRLAKSLQESGCKGLSVRNLKNFRQVTLAYPGLDVAALGPAFSIPEIRQTSAESPNRWSVQEFQRQRDSMLYERVGLSEDRDAVIARQFRITAGNRHYYVDLVLFHRRLRCLVAVDLKLGAFEPEHTGQLRFYVNYLAEHVAYPDENPPVGILLCAERNAEAVRFATAGGDDLFVSRYQFELPTEEQLKQWLQEERARLEQTKGDTEGEQ